MDIDVFPNSLEYWGPTGMVFFRNVQVRWMPVKETTRQLTLALERPGASDDTGRLTDRIELQNVTGRFPMPDFSGHYRMRAAGGYVEGGRHAAQDQVGRHLDDQFDLCGSDAGWGVNLSSALKVTDGDTLRLGLVYGEGIQNYMNDSPVDVGIVRNPATRSRR